MTMEFGDWVVVACCIAIALGLLAIRMCSAAKNHDNFIGWEKE